MTEDRGHPPGCKASYPIARDRSSWEPMDKARFSRKKETSAVRDSVAHVSISRYSIVECLCWENDGKIET